MNRKQFLWSTWIYVNTCPLELALKCSVDTEELFMKVSRCRDFAERTGWDEALGELLVARCCGPWCCAGTWCWQSHTSRVNSETRKQTLFSWSLLQGTLWAYWQTPCHLTRKTIWRAQIYFHTVGKWVNGKWEGTRWVIGTVHPLEIQLPRSLLNTFKFPNIANCKFVQLKSFLPMQQMRKHDPQVTVLIIACINYSFFLFLVFPDRVSL